MSERISGGSGISFGGALALIFITLKLLGVDPVASWSWLWVLSPIWIGIFAAVAILIVGFTISSVFSVINTRKKMKKFMDDELL